jgi:hypothetical protein
MPRRDHGARAGRQQWRGSGRDAAVMSWCRWRAVGSRLGAHPMPVFATSGQPDLPRPDWTVRTRRWQSSPAASIGRASGSSDGDTDTRRAGNLILWPLGDCAKSVSGSGTARVEPEMSRSICQIPARRLISIGRQPMLIVASRCYLIQMLRSAVTCANGCSCWSADEENSPRFFLTMDALYRLS